MKKILFFLFIIVCLVGLEFAVSEQLTKNSLNPTELLEEALTEARSIEDPISKISEILGIAKVYKKNGNIEKASTLIAETTQLIRDAQENRELDLLPANIIGSLSEIALGQNNLENRENALIILDEAYLLAKATSDDFERAFHLSLVAKVYADMGLKDKCRLILSVCEETANSPASDVDRMNKYYSMRDIASAYYKIGEKNRAWDELLLLVSFVESIDPDNIYDTWWGEQALLEFPNLYAEIGPYRKALDYAKKHEDIPALLRLAARDRKDDQIERSEERVKEVLKLIQSDNNRLNKAKKFYQIAIFYAENGLLEKSDEYVNQAESIVLDLRDDPGMEFKISNIFPYYRFYSLTLDENYVNALEWIPDLKSPSARCSSLVKVASIIIEKGQKKN